MSFLRPVVRSFSTRFSETAGEWVRQGGHAVIWDTFLSGKGKTQRKARYITPPIESNSLGELARFSLLDLGKKRWRIQKEGIFQGLIVVSIPFQDHWILKRRIERDSAFPAPLHRVLLNCFSCGACCKSNEVELQKQDLLRFLEGGREELLSPPFVRRNDGKLWMTLLPGKERRCRHLGLDHSCAIYPIRPDPCRDFPVASECCLATRESDLGIYDGIPPSES